MGRRDKEVLTSHGLDRRKVGYYSTPEFVSAYIARRCLEILPNATRFLDPCVGAGELVKCFLDIPNSQIIGFDVLDLPKPAEIDFRHEDFLKWFHAWKRYGEKGRFSSNCLAPQIIVANPPYNCHETDYVRENRRWLQQSFHDIGTHNMYSMFLAAIIEMAEEGAVIGVLTLDSFLTSKAHERLRMLILNQCSIHDVLLCPTDLFQDQKADVRTCVLILQKGRDYQNKVKILNRPLSQSLFKQDVAPEKSVQAIEFEKLTLHDSRDRNEFCVGVPDEIVELFSGPRLGEVFPCLTGISTGADHRYLSISPKPGYTVPFYKNPGSRKYYAEPNAYLIDDYLMESSRNAAFNVRNKELITKAGICCSSMGVNFSACIKPVGSVFGVNTTVIVEECDQWWLLAYLNSNLVRYMLRGVLVRTNMVTSGYVGRLPLPSFSDDSKNRLEELAKRIYGLAKDDLHFEEEQTQVNQVVYEVLDVRQTSRSYIDSFCTKIAKLA